MLEKTDDVKLEKNLSHYLNFEIIVYVYNKFAKIDDMLIS